MDVYRCNECIPFTIEIPGELYEIVRKYQERFTPQLGVETLMAELIGGEAGNWFAAQGKGIKEP